LFSEFNKQPIDLQAEIVEALEDFISAWKIKRQNLRFVGTIANILEMES